MQRLWWSGALQISSCFTYWLLNALIKARWRLHHHCLVWMWKRYKNATECVYSATIDVCAAIDASLWHLVGSSFKKCQLFRFVPKELFYLVQSTFIAKQGLLSLLLLWFTNKLNAFIILFTKILKNEFTNMNQLIHWNDSLKWIRLNNLGVWLLPKCYYCIINMNPFKWIHLKWIIWITIMNQTQWFKRHFLFFAFCLCAQWNMTKTYWKTQKFRVLTSYVRVVPTFQAVSQERWLVFLAHALYIFCKYRKACNALQKRVRTLTFTILPYLNLQER